MIITARQTIHERTLRKSFVDPEEVTTGVPLALQPTKAPLTPSFAEPLPQTPPIVRRFWSEEEQDFAQEASKELWAASKASVLGGASGEGSTLAGPTGEELFLAPQEVIAAEVLVISPVQALPSVKPCPYVDIRIAMEADRAMHVGATVAFPKEAFGQL